MYKIAEHNANEILESTNVQLTSFTHYCNLNIVYNGLDYKFCMGECSLEGCTGQYHKYTIVSDQTVFDGASIISLDDYKTSLSIPQTLSEIKVAIDQLKHTKTEWFDYDNHYQRFLDSDERKIEAAIKGLTVQPLFENIVDESGNITGTTPIMDGEIQAEGKLVETIRWKYPSRDIDGNPIDGQYDYVNVSDANYFFLMQVRGNLHGNVCFGAEELTVLDLNILVESGGDLSTFDYEVVFNGHYDGLVASYL